MSVFLISKNQVIRNYYILIKYMSLIRIIKTTKIGKIFRPKIKFSKPIPPPPPKGLQKALLIGVNYVGTPYELYGCINDCKLMEDNLRKLFPKCKEYRNINDHSSIKPTRKNIIDSINWLTSGLKPGQNIFLHYSGHGGLIRDRNGDEVLGYDSCLYPIDNGKIEVIIDDEIRNLLAMRVPAGCKCFVILDCCHSGSAVDLRYTYQSPNFGQLTYREDKKYVKTSGNILFLSGCHDFQQAMETVSKEGKPSGAMTMALIDTWKQYGAGIKTKYLLWDVRKYLKENGYTQIPQLSSGNYWDPNMVFDLNN